MELDTQALLRILKWADTADRENQMNSADYDLAMSIAVQAGNPLLAEEFAGSRLSAIEREEYVRELRRSLA